MKKDITDKNDITFFVERFYTKVLQDELLSPLFTHVHFKEHLPKMIHFWSFVLLDEPGYKTDVTRVHLNMPLTKDLFDRWITLFNHTIDENFDGFNADKAKQRAFLMRWTMESKIV